MDVINFYVMIVASFQKAISSFVNFLGVIFIPNFIISIIIILAKALLRVLKLFLRPFTLQQSLLYGENITFVCVTYVVCPWNVWVTLQTLSQTSQK